MASQPARQSFTYEVIAGVTVTILFLTTRFVGLTKNNELESHDSLGYIQTAGIFRSLDFQAILDLTPTSLPLYSIAIAIFSLLTGELEIAARLVSLAASAATALAIFLLAKRLSAPWGGIIAVAILAVNPYLIRFSYSILSEPLYSAIFAWALYIFVAQVRSPDIKSWLVLGLLGGIAFAARFESILLFASLPFLQAVFLCFAQTKPDKSHLGKIALVYLCTFTVLTAPQVWRVSEQMNSFALNGRTVWKTILSADDGKPFHHKLYGLDYSPVMTNLHYLFQNPEARSELAQSKPLITAVSQQTKNIIVNMERIHVDLVPRLIGIPVFAFAVIGFLVILRSAYVAEAMSLLLILGIGLTAPLVYRVTLDHIALVAPPLTMLAGIGVNDSIRSLVQVFGRSFACRMLLITCLIGAATAPYGIDMFRLYTKPDDPNSFYNQAAIRDPVAELQRATAGTDRTPRILSTHGFIAYFAGVERVIAPWTDFTGLRVYMDAHHVDFVYINKYLQEHPFVSALDSPEWNREFTLLYEGNNEDEGVHKLYSRK